MADQDRRYIFAVGDRTVRNPEMSYMPIPKEGIEVVWSLEWEKLKHYGDIRVETDEQRKARESKAEEAAKAAKAEAKQVEDAGEIAEAEKAPEAKPAPAPRDVGGVGRKGT